MKTEELKTWWQDAQEAARPAKGAAAVVAYLKDAEEASLEDLRELLTDEEVSPGEQLHVLANLVDQGVLQEHDDEDGLTYTLKAGEPTDVEMSQSPWVLEHTAKGTPRWRHSGTGAVRYQRAQPLERGGAEQAPAEQPPTKPERTREQTIDHLMHLYEAERRNQNVMPTTGSLANYQVKARDPEAIAGKVMGALGKADPYSPPTIEGMYNGLKAAHPDLTVADFHGLLGKLAGQGKVRLESYTRALAEYPHDPRLIFPVDGELKYVVLPARTAQGQLSHAGNATFYQRLREEMRAKRRPGS